jgi:tryptophan-rich hypothetical protein
VNRINPKKLLHSKWTAVHPQNREKHFAVTEVEFDEQGEVVHCLLEAVHSKRELAIDWRQLRDPGHWLFGWR